MQSFRVLRGFLRIVAVDAVPVLARCNWHPGNCEVLVQLVKRRACAAAAAGDNRRADLHRLVERGGVEQAVKQIRQRAVRAGVVDGRADNQRIRRLELRGEGVYGIVKNAVVQHAAAPTGNAAANVLLTDVDDFSRQPTFLQGVGDLGQGKINCAVRVGRTVE